MLKNLVNCFIFKKLNKMKKKLFIAATFLVFNDFFGQTSGFYDPYIKEPLPKNSPEWFQQIEKNPSKVNFFEMEKLFNHWLATDHNAKIKTIDKKPSVNFYRRWAKVYRPFVSENGTIQLPSTAEYLADIDKRNALPSHKKYARGGNVWRNIGPNTTVDKAPGRPNKDSQVCVFRLDVAPSNHSTLYSGTETGMVFKTTNKGESWQACNGSHDFGGSIYAIKVHPSDPNTVYVGGGNILWKTTDGGETWNRLQDVNARVNSIRVNPNNPKNISVATVNGFYISEDAGNSFKQITTTECHDHELQPGNPSKIYLLSKSNSDKFTLKISENGGKSFNEEVNIIDNIVAGRLAVSEAPTGQNYVYALVNVSTGRAIQNENGKGGRPHILQSTDAGKTWTDKTQRFASWRDSRNTFCPFVDETHGGQGYFDMMIGVSNKNPEHIIYGLCSGYRSTQGGSGSSRENAIGGYCSVSNMHPDMQDIVIAGDDTWISTDGGVKYSNNFFETKGEDRHKGIYASDYHGFGQGWNEDVMAGGRWHNGDVVHVAKYGEGKTLHLGGVEQATGYVFLSNPYKTYFSDAGVHTVPENISGNVKSDYNTLFFNKKPYETLKENGFIETDPRYALRVLINPNDDIDRDKIFASTDEGVNFNEIAFTDGEFISNFSFARSNPDHIYVNGIYDIWYSTDNGKNWDFLENRPFDRDKDYFNGNPGSFLAIHPKDEKIIWVAKPNKGGKVAYTTDGGKTWTNALENTRLKNAKIRWIVLVGDDKNGVYLGADDEIKVYYKDDSLNDWIDYSDGLPGGKHARLTKLEPFYKEGKLRAATSQGIWEIPLYNQNFEPTAQPIALNLGKPELSNPEMEVQLDSYSIINQNGAKWEWTFSPEPKWISDKNIRNPKVIFSYNGEYDITLKVTNNDGKSHSRTIKKMVIVKNGRNLSTSNEDYANAVSVVPTAINAGEDLQVSYPQSFRKVSFNIYDAKGGLIKSLEMKDNPLPIRVSTHGLTKGVYIYQLKSDTTKHFGRFIVK